MKPDQTTMPESAEPEIVKLSLGEYISQIAGLVADVQKRHRIPHGTAFQIVAFAIHDFDARANAAEAAKELATLQAEKENAE